MASSAHASPKHPRPGAVSRTRDHFLIDPDRPIAYLHLSHIGLGTPEIDGKPHERVWMELHNNCAFPINLRVNGAPMGDSPDSVSVMDRHVPIPQFHVLTPEEDAELGSRDMPRDTSLDVGSGYTLEPGEHLLFSLPASHFSRRWSIQIHFSFDLHLQYHARRQRLGWLHLFVPLLLLLRPPPANTDRTSQTRLLTPATISAAAPYS